MANIDRRQAIPLPRLYFEASVSCLSPPPNDPMDALYDPDETFDPFEIDRGGVPRRILVTSRGERLTYHGPRKIREARPRKKKSPVRTFSRAARLRMLKTFHELDWKNIMNCLFLTLTYADETNIRENFCMKRHRSELWRKVEHHMGQQVAAIWRVEWEVRKSGARVGELMPHLHYLVFGLRYLDKDLLADWWEKIVGVRSRTKVQAIVDKKAAGIYVAKYSSKLPSESVSLSLLHFDAIPTGRHWGFHRKELLPWAPGYAWEAEEAEDTIMFRDHMLQGRKPVDKWGNETFTVFGPLAGLGQLILKQFGLTDERHEQ